MTDGYDYDEEKIAAIKLLDSKDFSATTVIIENDNPVWSVFIKFGALIMSNSESPAYTRDLRISSLSRSTNKLETRLGKGRYLLEWEGNTFDVVINSEESKEEAIIHLKDTDASSAFENFIRHCREYSRRKEDNTHIVVKVMKGSVWRQVSTYPKRQIESLITGDDTANELICDMKKFLKSEDDYNKFGMPFKRNYLLVGPPGSGKSSLVTLAASELNHDVCFFTVTSGMNEKDLCLAISALSDNSIFVIEDVDVLCSSAMGGNSTALQSLAVLTNILDGTLHRHKLITILTSANPDALEQTLTRHGRIDFTSKLKPLSEIQVKDMVAYTHQNASPKLAEKLWNKLEILGNITSTVLMHFLFRNRSKTEKEFTSKVIDTLGSGTHKEHVSDGRRDHPDLYM